MININERNNSPSKKNSSIKTKCKIHSHHYYIQIYTDGFTNSEKITFLIKTKKENERNSFLYKRIFNYIELIDYNKYFKYFSSLEDILINIAQCIEEKKYLINKGFKCLSLILNIYIRKLKKYVNIYINLNQHKNLNPLSINSSEKKEIKKIMLGVQNKEELSYAIYDIRQRLKNLEMNQSMMNNNVFNRNNELNHINKNLQQCINNSTNLNEYYNNNAFQIKYYNQNLNKKKFNNKISANSSMNNLNEGSNMNYQNNSVLNITNTNYFKNSSNNLFPKNLKINEKHRISGVDDIIKKINILETKTNTKDNPNKDLDYKLNYIDSKKNEEYNYMPYFKKKTVKNKEINKSVEINRRNENSFINLNNNDTTQIDLVKKNQLNSVFNNEKSMNGSQIIDKKDINKDYNINICYLPDHFSVLMDDGPIKICKECFNHIFLLFRYPNCRFQANPETTKDKSSSCKSVSLTYLKLLL